LHTEVGRSDPPDYTPQIDLTPCELGAVYAVSRRHAELYWADGKLWLADLGSRNGTLLDGRLLTGPGPRQPTPPLEVKAGSVITFANLECDVLV
jgi:pSer/pThr/pTyr-binding forkhead associated (FHA) protein